MKPVTKTVSKKGRSFSLFLIPDDHSRVQKIHIGAGHLRLVVGGMVVVTLFCLFNVVGFWYYRSLNSSLLAQRDAFEQFQKEKVGLVDKVRTLEDTVNQTEKYAAQLGALVGTASPTLAKGVGPIPADEFSVQGHTAGLDDALDLGAVEPKVEGLQARAKGLQAKIQELYKTQRDHLNFIAATPSLWPVKGWVTSDFGVRRSPFGYHQDFHEGMDIATQWGTPVVASADGIVTWSNYKGGLGKAVIIDHGFGVKTVYGHNSSLLVQEGQRVAKGTPIALVGSTGHSTGPHCHFEVRVDGLPVDPMRFLMGEGTTVASAKKLRHR